MELLGDDLDPVRWAQLCCGPDHCPGGGVDIPDVLRGLAAAEEYPEARQWGDRLFDLVFHGHSGSYLLPAAPVVPILVRLSSSERAGVQAVALGLLVYLGTGETSWADGCPASEDLEQRVSAAVQAGMPTYYTQLQAHDPRVRAAAFVLVTVLEHAGLLRLTGSARTAVATGPPIASERYRRTVEWLHERDWDPLVRRHLGLAQVDPLFGHGDAYYGIEFEY
ncbi:hypothetical protein [Streptacidiphilus anmyonensis]|uniref:hypothetical protein n=1 Tax=Streptacidiphilus anmyonensis TaxID=405782 RepID=UPI0005A7886B|nr:hypothetical protein [Streptacidiphilus anmyonensis]